MSEPFHFTAESEDLTVDPSFIMDIEQNDTQPNETEEAIQENSDEYEGPRTPTYAELDAETNVDAILLQNPDIALNLSGFLNDTLPQSISDLAKLSPRDEGEGEIEASQTVASHYAEVVKKKRKRVSQSTKRPVKTPRTIKDQKALGEKLATFYAGVQEKTWEDGTLGAGMGGTFAKSHTTKRGGRSYKGERAKQFLHQVCVRLYDYAANEARTNPTEVQALFVNGRIVFAANEDMAKAMLASFKSQNHDHLLGLLTEPPTERTVDNKFIEHSRYQASWNAHLIATELMDKAEEFDEDGRVTYITEDTTEADEALLDDIFDSLMYGSHSDAWDGGSVSNAVAWLTREDTERGVFWCDPSELGGNVHAEQALTVILARACPSSPAQITGTMRPCVGCYLTMLYGVEKLGLKIPSPKNPGGFWKGTQVDGFIGVIDERQLQLDEIHQAALDNLGEAQQTALEEFKKFMREKFPTDTFATAFLQAQVGPTDVGPDKPFRRTLTKSKSDFAEMAEWARQQELNPTVPKKRTKKDDDGEFFLVEEEPKKSSKKKQPEKEKPKKPVVSTRSNRPTRSTRAKGGNPKYNVDDENEEEF